MITLQNITLQRGKKVLLENGSATIFAKQKVGLVGVNGSGKSSLFSLILQKISPDGGEVHVQSNIRISYLAQEVPNTEISALQYVMNGDAEVSKLTKKLKEAEDANDGYLITELHNKLYELAGYANEAKAAKLLVGLGFRINEHQNAVNSFSGGWRMRLNLAQVLMSRADLLLLDEPTNYLDMDTIVWLEKWLQNYDGTLLLISHDRDFLDNVVEKVIHIGGRKLDTYSGNYSSFERQKAEKLAQEKSLYEKQQERIAHLNKYVDRFRAKASKARQAQSRIKMIEKMEKVSITHIDSPFSFKFYKPESCGTPLVSVSKASVSYGEKNVLDKISFGLNPGESVGVLGINGAGKSTFVKSLAGILKAKSGEVVFNKNIKIGYFAQHQVDQLDMDSSPLEHILRITPDAKEQQVRTFLGGFGFGNEMALSPITNFSGGEKARLVLSLIIWQKPNLLLLDEPTNHLDLEMREALTYALQDYEGALVLVAHDRYLLKAVVDEFYLVNDKKVTKFEGDLDDYQKWLLDTRKEQFADFVAKKEGIDERSSLKKERKKTNAEFKRAQSLEKKIEKLQVEKEKIASVLSDPEIYDQENSAKLKDYLKRSSELEKELALLEEEWFVLIS